MRLTLAIHPVTEMRFGDATKLSGTRLDINKAELTKYIMEDKRLKSVEIEVVRPGENARVGMVYDVIEPRAKEPGHGPDFPGIISPHGLVGQGTTHVLRGAAVTVVDEGDGQGMDHRGTGRGGSKILEMSGEPAKASLYGSLQHLVVVPHCHEDQQRHSVLNAVRVASIKAAVYIARAGIGQRPATQEIYDLEGPHVKGREGLPRLAFIAALHGHQFGTDLDEHVFYGSPGIGMMATPLHPNQWMDGAVVISYSWNPLVETYHQQNQPIIKELYRRHMANECTFVGTIVRMAADLEEERDRDTWHAAALAKWCLGAEGVIVIRYSGGAQHADMFEAARKCELIDISSVVLVGDMAPDRRAESAVLINIPEVKDVVCLGNAGDLRWQVPTAERVIAGSKETAARLAKAQELVGMQVCGIANDQGAQKLASIVY